MFLSIFGLQRVRFPSKLAVVLAATMERFRRTQLWTKTIENL